MIVVPEPVVQAGVRPLRIPNQTKIKDLGYETRVLVMPLVVHRLSRARIEKELTIADALVEIEHI